MASLDASDPEIQAAVADVFDKATDTNWAMLTYAPRSSTKLRLLGKGTDGWDEMCEEVSDGKICYGLCRFTINEVYRFVYLSWIGEGVQGAQAGAYNSHSGRVALMFEGFHVQINGRNDNDLWEEDVVARLSKAIGAAYDAGQSIQGVQGKDANSGAPKQVTRTDAGVIDQKASAQYWEQQNEESGAPASGYQKDMSFQKASGASSLKSKFESLAEEQKPNQPARSAPPKPIKMETSNAPSVIESTPAASQVSYDNSYGSGATYEDQGESYDEGAAYDDGASYGQEQEAYEEQGYAEEAYEEQGYAEEAGYGEQGYAEEGGYEEEAYPEEGYAEEAYAEEGGYEGGAEVYATALYDYAGENEGDLAFSAGDNILVLDQSDPSGWWQGMLNGQEGYFPSNFVELTQ